MLKKYKAVFFDVGGTLLRVHPSVGEVYAEIARDFGFSGSADAVDEQFRLQWKETGGIESLGRQSGLAVEKKFWRDLVFAVFEHFGGLRDFETYFEKVFEAFRGKDRWRVYEDVLDSGILQTLKGQGVVLGVISNWDSRLPDTLNAMGLARHFDFILASAQVGAAKPDQKIFLEALQLSGVKASEACHIGDEPIADIKGALQVGVDAILIDRTGRFDSFAGLKIRSFLELG
jgi:putative hydrolase of the HAD superfamily